MYFRSAIFFCTAVSLFLLAGCAPHSPIDAKKTGARTVSSVSKSASGQLTDKDIFGNETTLSVSEEDIQAALEGNMFHVPLNSSVILVQSGSRAPEIAMQQEMSKYYTIATFSGIPDRQKAISCNKDENGGTVASENMNWMQALRFVAAKGHQKAIIVYQDMLQSGRYDSVTRTTVWSDYKDGKLTDLASLRYLVRFTLVDVATGEWATWSPVNYEYSVLSPLLGKNMTSATEATEQQITQLKQKTYAAIVKDLVNRYQ
ncbi:hypothetical protein [Hafnia alvei]|uniref:hypothetical protein n=1 Tax=Hafnia alvei TaxID=569 RepID=UPI00061D290A|nr:hypothetical protein [Hafnia alvei]KKF38814.1 hypothetical protein PU01_21150 [Hafnia alvei]MBW3474977.1 hypothetical protein [Hafnia alvei]